MTSSQAQHTNSHSVGSAQLRSSAPQPTISTIRSSMSANQSAIFPTAPSAQPPPPAKLAKMVSISVYSIAVWLAFQTVKPALTLPIASLAMVGSSSIQLL